MTATRRSPAAADGPGPENNAHDDDVAADRSADVRHAEAVTADAHSARSLRRYLSIRVTVEVGR